MNALNDLAAMIFDGQLDERAPARLALGQTVWLDGRQASVVHCSPDGYIGTIDFADASRKFASCREVCTSAGVPSRV